MIARLTPTVLLLAAWWLVGSPPAHTQEPQAEKAAAPVSQTGPANPLPDSAAAPDRGVVPAPPQQDVDEETAALLALPPDPAETVEKVFESPRDVVRLSKDGRLWVDKKGKQVIVDGYVAMSRGMLEMFACPAGTKEHESVVAVLARSRDVHTALLAVGAQSGTPVQYVPKFVSATGQPIRVWVMWFDNAGELRKTDARNWVVKTGTKQTLKEDWVFAGSNFWKDPSDGQVYYEADAGDLICVSNFSSAMMDLPVLSSKDTAALQYSAAEGTVPEEATPVRLILIPVPLPVDHPEPQDEALADPNKPPADKWLVKRETGKAVDVANPRADNTSSDAASKAASP